MSSIAHTWGTTAEERALAFPGDRAEDTDWTVALPRRLDRGSAAGVFRWLCQLRVAPYSYDWIDNGGRRSPRTLTPGLEQLEVGQTIVKIFRLESFEAPSYMTLVTPAGRPRRVAVRPAPLHLLGCAPTERDARRACS